MSHDDGPRMFQDQLAEKVRPFIDLVDDMRSIGIDKELPLPTIVVVGDQSSGKSSVLETLSGVALPRGTGIVTRCPLLLQLCNDRTVKWEAVISYGGKFNEFDDPSEVVRYVEQAQNALAGKGVGICEDLITLKITSSTVCDLSLIDLPGITRVAVKGQPDDIGAQIKNLISKFIKNKRTIILVVVPCNVDIATTEALKMAQEVDPEGTRTLAILTKPDLIDPGAEKNVLEIVHNKVIILNMGYVIVKCRGQKQIDENMSITHAIEEELEFFRNHEHFRSLLHEEKATTKCLANKLSNALVKHIKKSLPKMSKKIKEQLGEVKHLLSQIESGPPLEPAEKRKYLIQVITDFNDQITQLSKGDIIVEENLFELMRKEFTEWMECLKNAKSHYHEVVQQVVDEYDQKHRGSELPGFTNYRVFQHVVQKLVAELKNPAMMTLQKIRDMVQKQFNHLSRESFKNYPYLHQVSKKKIETIQENQSTIVKERIVEQFQMEMQVYTQDEIFNKHIPKEGETAAGSDKDTRSKYPGLLKAYYEIVVQRLADQVPMLIRYFILKQSAKIVCSEMLDLLHRDDTDNILQEDSEIGQYRAKLLAQADRLILANDKISSL
ncbi:interferon-induced GTP-binding protein Mx [Salmo salar]|uniref:Interferon-induced GTP-binding protein Mx-like n=1 Tax=Salmo salar TaxID=8030 RepID=A0A1S3PQY7_SALSA|nr:interferon-induced GTP-binding protein Mx-like [Salmo salar]XP_045563693.1 interferon-induced GTP-binding protein Mx-like [Salmo salar]